MNKVLAIAAALLCGFLVSFRPDLALPVSMVFWAVVTYQMLQRGKGNTEKMRITGLRQKLQAETVALPDPMTLLGMLIQITEQGEPTQEALQTLVYFACRLSLSNLWGQKIVSLEDPDTQPTYGINREPFLDGDFLELPGLRGGEKDRIGSYRFWRSTEHACFTSTEGPVNALPEFMIHFDRVTLAPNLFAVLKEQTPMVGTYLCIWGARRGDKMAIVF